MDNLLFAHKTNIVVHVIAVLDDHFDLLMG